MCSTVLLYGTKEWNFTEASCKKLKTFEMWLYRRTSWTWTNKAVLSKLKKEKVVLYTVKTHNLQYLDQTMRSPVHYELCFKFQVKDGFSSFCETLNAITWPNYNRVDSKFRGGLFKKVS